MQPIAQARYDARSKDGFSGKDMPSPNEDRKRAKQTSTSEGESTSGKHSTIDDGGPARPSLAEDRDIVQWGVRMYKKFGLTDQEINVEIPEALSRREAEKDR